MLASPRPSLVVVGLVVAGLVAMGCGSRTSLDILSSLPVDASVAASRDVGGTLDSGTPDSGTSMTKPDASVGFPVGTFTSCAQGLSGPDGILTESGIESGATLTVTREGSAIDAKYTDENGSTSRFVFTQTLPNAATLAKPAMISGFEGLCVKGPGDDGSFPVVVNGTVGDLTYDADTLFLSVEGTVEEEGGSSCVAGAVEGRAWIACGGTAPADTTVASSATFLNGTYSCATQLDSHIESDGTQDYAAGGDTGTLVLTQSGGQVTATYEGDETVTGSIDFAVTSERTATLVAGGTLSAPCIVPIDIMGAPPSETPEALSVEAASLVVDGPWLTLTFRGTMTASSCSGALVMASLLCIQ